MKFKKWFHVVIILIIISGIALGVVGYKIINFKVSTIKDLAYDVNKRAGYTVYIKENSKYVPYLVLTSKYNGNTLLLRKDLLDQTHTFNDDSWGDSGYYPDSSIDKFLNKDFINRLDSKVQRNIVNSQITITTKSSLGVTGEQTENINRKVFLLSCTEIGLDSDSSIACVEGKELKYFRNVDNRIAYRNNSPRSWWLRTSYTWYIHSAWGIGPEGTIGGGQVDNSNGIRPVFCLKNTQAVEKSDKVVSGKTVYIITE